MKLKVLITGGNGNIANLIKKNLNLIYDITNPSRSELDMINFDDLKNYLDKNNFDILVHTAIIGGRRNKEENGEVTHLNLIMMENILKFSDKFKMIINLDSAAIYDRKTDILNRKEHELYTIPKDYYGFSKYVIYQRSLQYKNLYNFRIFNLFNVKEEADRFIKSCFLSKKYNNKLCIFEDKYFDFFYEDDFIKIVKFYFEKTNNQENLEKTINICYKEKYKLSDIAKIILNNNNNNINIVKNESQNNYSGDNSLLEKLNIDFIGLIESLKIYESILN
jgi:GDP-L-fucose synthase